MKVSQEAKAQICSCGRPLIPVYNSEGKQLGVTHSDEDEEWHYQYGSGLKNMQERGFSAN